jgi:hypothetical protein
MNPLNWPPGLQAAAGILVLALVVTAFFLPSEPAWRVMGQIVSSAAGLAP